MSETPQLKCVSRRNLKPDEPCGHRGCLSHVSHPCEGCGRLAGRLITWTNSMLTNPNDPFYRDFIDGPKEWMIVHSSWAEVQSRTILFCGPSEAELKDAIHRVGREVSPAWPQWPEPWRPFFRFCRGERDICCRVGFLAFIWGERWMSSGQWKAARFLNGQVMAGRGEWLDDKLVEGHPLSALIKELRR